MASTTLSNDLTDLNAAALESIECRTQEIGRHIFTHLRESRTHIFQRRWWADRIMAWTMRDELLKVELFRFVDVLPMLHTSDAVSHHLHEYLGRVGNRLPMAARGLLSVVEQFRFLRAIEARIARLGAMDFARRFIAGANTQEVLSASEHERRLKRGFTLDILGEAVTSEKEAEQYLGAYISLLESVAPVANAWPAEPQIDQDAAGDIPRVNLSIKLSALDSQFDAIDPDGATERVGQRLRQLLRAAQRNGAFINVDMESYDKKDLTLHIFQSVLNEPEFRDQPHVGIVIQCYLRDAASDLVMLRDWAQRRGTPVWVRLVKGAYWDYETIHAQANDWPVPVWQRKWQSDANFEWATRFVLQNSAHLRAALGTHNVRSMAHGMAVAEHLGVPKNGLEIQMLYGMADAEKQVLVDLGHRLRIYMPYGELIPGMAYLVRRLLENTSNESFLRAGFVERRSPDDLLRNPKLAEDPGSEVDSARPQTITQSSAGIES